MTLFCADARAIAPVGRRLYSYICTCQRVRVGVCVCTCYLYVWVCIITLLMFQCAHTDFPLLHQCTCTCIRSVRSRLLLGNDEYYFSLYSSNNYIVRGRVRRQRIYICMYVLLLSFQLLTQVIRRQCAAAAVCISCASITRKNRIFVACIKRNNILLTCVCISVWFILHIMYVYNSVRSHCARVTYII